MLRRGISAHRTPVKEGVNEEAFFFVHGNMVLKAHRNAPAAADEAFFVAPDAVDPANEEPVRSGQVVTRSQLRVQPGLPELPVRIALLPEGREPVELSRVGISVNVPPPCPDKGVFVIEHAVFSVMGEGNIRYHPIDPVIHPWDLSMAQIRF